MWRRFRSQYCKAQLTPINFIWPYDLDLWPLKPQLYIRFPRGHRLYAKLRDHIINPFQRSREKNVIMQTVAQSEGKAEVSGWGGSNGREILNWWTVCRLHDINSQNGACTSRHCVRWVTNNDVCCYAAPPRWVILQNGAVRLSVCPAFESTSFAEWELV